MIGEDHQPEAWGAAEKAARESYGRLLAWLARQWRDVAAAEDALGEAFAAALATWPQEGVPRSPEAWLLTAARRRLLQAHRHRKVESDPGVLLRLLQENEQMTPEAVMPDERLKLLFVCAHPAIDPAVRTALMLQTVLGLEASRIATAFLVSPAAMAQRLVRAKARIREAAVAFEEPEPEELQPRTHAVLEAVYAAYGLGAEGVGESDTSSSELTAEALYLARLLYELLPGSPEAAGLLSLLLFCEGRKAARYSESGEFIPLGAQDTTLWNRSMLAEADQILWAASQQHLAGPFQIEAAIQSAHCQRGFGAAAPWPAIATLYDALVAMAATTGALVGRAVAHGEASTPLAGLRCLDRIDPEAVRAYQPYWVARGHLQMLAGDAGAAHESYQKAIGLTSVAALRTYLQSRLDQLPLH